jgi:hypothetical protein
MENQQQGYLKPLQILFGALLGGQTMMSLIFYFFVGFTKTEDDNTTLSTFLPLIMLALTVTGYFLFNMRRKTWAEETDLDAKKSLYRTASLTKWAAFEAATLLGIIGYFFLGIQVLLLPVVISLAHFCLHFPSRERVSRELGTDNLD